MSDIRQIDVFGNETDPPPLPSRKTPTMQERYGITEGKTCKTCVHCYDLHYHDYHYKKCDLWDQFFRGSSEASDIRLKNKACGKYEEEQK